jgi:trigger factor
MNITQESTGNLTAMIRIELVPEDYANQVTNSLKEIQKKSALKGFRPGKVPFGLIKKMYEKDAVAEEVNKILSESLNKYIVDNKLEILGYPLPNIEKTKSVDFESDALFDFYFDIGLTPPFELDLTQITSAPYYEIKVEDKIIDSYLEDSRRRYGKFIEGEIVEDGDMIEGDITQIDEAGNPVPDWITKKVTLSMKQIKDESSRAAFLGKKTEENVRFNPMISSGSAVDTAAMLGIKKEEAENMHSDFNFIIKSIKRIEPAALDAELFKKVYPSDEIKEIDEFRKRIAVEAGGYYQAESENFFVHETIEKLHHEIQFDLPEEFIKRWLVDSEKDLTIELVEKNINDYLHSLKQQLILSKITKNHEIRISDQEIKDYIKDYFIKQYAFAPENEEMTKYINSMIESVLKNNKEVNRIQDQLFDEKLKTLFKEKMKLEKKEITYENFVKLVSDHHKTHHHEHE